MNHRERHPSKRRRIISGAVFLSLMLIGAVLVVVSLLHEPDAEGDSGPLNPIMIIGIAVAVGAALLAFFFLQQAGKRHQLKRLPQLAEWAEAYGWRQLQASELGQSVFPHGAKGPEITVNGCNQLITGSLNGRAISVESWDLEHRKLGSAWSSPVVRPVVRVSASPRLPAIALGASGSPSQPLLKGPPQLAAHAHGTNGALSHVAAELQRLGMTVHGPFIFFGEKPGGQRTAELLGRFQTELYQLGAWVVTSPGELALTFLAKAPDTAVLERRIRLAGAMADDLDRY